MSKDSFEPAGPRAAAELMTKGAFSAGVASTVVNGKFAEPDIRAY